MSPWMWLVGAGVAEVLWSQSIRPTDGFTRPGPTLLCVLLMIAAVYPLTRAMRDLPVGTAYVAFTGIGAVGAVVLGMVVSDDPVSAPRLAGLVAVVGGVIALRLAEG